MKDVIKMNSMLLCQTKPLTLNVNLGNVEDKIIGNI